MNIVVNAQANTISGGGKAETIYGEAGNDKILGGAGFVYGSGDGKDVITDYTAGQDKIKLASGSITVQNGKGKKITIVDAAGKTSTKTYSGAVSGRSALWFMEGDDNFITGATELSATIRDSCSESAIGDLSVSSDIVNLTAELAPTAPIFRATEKN